MRGVDAALSKNRIVDSASTRNPLRMAKHSMRILERKKCYGESSARRVRVLPRCEARTKSISCNPQIPLDVDGGRTRLERVVNNRLHNRLSRHESGGFFA